MNSRWSRLAGIERGKLKKGPWTFEEDIRLLRYIRLHGDGRWSALAKAAGLQRCGKSCRLRWVNYLRPDLKRGKITEEEERVIIEMHARWGNRWSLIAERLPGRTDNEIKNYWRSHLKKKLQRPENTYDLKSCQLSCNCSISDSSNVSGQAASAQPMVKNSLYSTVTISSPSSSSGENSANHYYPTRAMMRLDIPPTASSMSQEFVINTNTGINSIISEDAIKIKGHRDIDGQGHPTQLSLTSFTSCNDPEIRCAQNDGETAGMGPSFYSDQALERDVLSAIPYQFYSGIPSEIGDIAATGLQISTPHSGDVDVTNPVLDHHADYEMETCLDLGSYMTLWNMCPIPSTQSELQQLPFTSSNVTAEEQYSMVEPADFQTSKC